MGSLTIDEFITPEVIDPGISREQAALTLGITVRTLQRYLTWIGEIIPQFHKYVDFSRTTKSNEFALTGVRISQQDLDFLKKIVDYRKTFSKEQVTSILIAYADKLEEIGES